MRSHPNKRRFILLGTMSLLLVLWPLGSFSQSCGPITPDSNCPAYASDTGGLNPCGHLYNLLALIQNQNCPNQQQPVPFPNVWTNDLAWDYYNWHLSAPRAHSENRPMMAHATALYLPGAVAPHDPVAWWNTFLDCQTGKGCTVQDNPSNPLTLEFIKGKELLSGDYDAESTMAVMAVYYWALTHNNQDLAVRASFYLRISWALYAMATGVGTDGTGHAQTLTIADEGVTYSPCQTVAFNGYWPALSGMRGIDTNLCQLDERTYLFARALQIPNNWGTIEPHWERTYLNYLESLPLPQQSFPGNSIYSLLPSHVAILQSQTHNGDQVAFLVNFLSSVRTSVTYHFLGWNVGRNQLRATLMEGNLNHSTAPTFGAYYDSSGKAAQILLPWPSGQQRNIQQVGHAWIDGPSCAPTAIHASNDVNILDDTILLPGTPVQYHVVFTRNNGPVIVSCP